VNYLFLLFAFSVLPLTGLSQYSKDTVVVENDSTICYIPNIICVDGISPFINWFDIPSEFSFDLYDRWGRPVFQTEKHDFIFEDFLEYNGIKTPEGSYYYRLTFTSSGGTKHELQGTLYYYNWYCNCG
jgi:hypothetical protein